MIQIWWSISGAANLLAVSSFNPKLFPYQKAVDFHSLQNFTFTFRYEDEEKEVETFFSRNKTAILIVVVVLIPILTAYFLCTLGPSETNDVTFEGVGGLSPESDIKLWVGGREVVNPN